MKAFFTILLTACCAMLIFLSGCGKKTEELCLNSFAKRQTKVNLYVRTVDYNTHGLALEAAANFWNTHSKIPDLIIKSDFTNINFWH